MPSTSVSKQIKAHRAKKETPTALDDAMAVLKSKAPAKRARKKTIQTIYKEAVQVATRTRRLIFDTETTGLLKPGVADLKDQPKIIEFCIIDIDDQYNIHGEWSWLINPGEPISAEITKITGLTDADLEGKPSFIEVLPEIERVFFASHELVAHNLPFDMGMLTNELARIGRQFAFPYPMKQTCTAQMSQDVFGKRHRLIQLYEKATGTPLAQTHRARDDVMALIETIRALKW